MRLIDEEEMSTRKKRNQKTKRIIVILIILLLLLFSVIVVLIAYKANNPTQITAYIDGVKVSGLENILDVTTDENGETQIYFPIREFATYLNNVNPEFQYQTFKGDYNPKTEDDGKCYVYRSGYEVVMYSQKSKSIYKLDLQDKEEDYEECVIDNEIFKSNDKLYASIDGIEKGYNTEIVYDENKKVLQIYTLDYFINAHQIAIENTVVENYGTLSIGGGYNDSKSIFEGLLIVKASNGKYGIVKTENYSSFILEPQYDNISYINDSSVFLVESNKKVGLFTKDGKRKIDMVYDQITSMGQNSKLYVVETNKMQGVVDENGKILVYPEYEQVGIGISNYAYNGVKNGYILLDKLIPIRQNGLWALYDKNGKRLSDGFKYLEIGCSSIKSGNNVYPLLEIPEYDVIVVSDENGEYGFVDTEGNDAILKFLFDSIYIKVSEGKESYIMIFRDQEYDVLEYISKVKDRNDLNIKQDNNTTDEKTNNTAEERGNNTDNDVAQNKSNNTN